MTEEKKPTTREEFIDAFGKAFTGKQLQTIMIKTGPTAVRCPCCFQGSPIDKIVNMSAEYFGGTLECEVCGETRALNAEAFKQIFETTWPEHCGKRMVWKTRYEIAQEVP